MARRSLKVAPTVEPEKAQNASAVSGGDRTAVLAARDAALQRLRTAFAHSIDMREGPEQFQIAAREIEHRLWAESAGLSDFPDQNINLADWPRLEALLKDVFALNRGEDYNELEECQTLFAELLRSFIELKPTEKSIAERLELLDLLLSNAPEAKASELVRNIFPELAAMQELRDQLRVPEIASKPPYPGKRAGIDPVQFLLEHYGEDIREGRIGPGYVHEHDGRLYQALYLQLTADNPPSPGNSRSVANFFESHTRPEKQGGAVARRIKAASTVLGASEEVTAKFFQTLRTDRVSSSHSARVTRGRR